MNGAEVRQKLRRGVYIVPTSLTVLNIFFGFTAIMLSMRAVREESLGDLFEAGRMFRLACWSLAAAALFDTFDGLVARLMKATSEFGKEYDSIADVVTFGAAPAVLVYAWALHNWHRLGVGIAFLFLVAGSLRLARFNIQHGKADHRYFVGLPIPAGALTLAGIINYAPQPVQDQRFAAVMLVVTAGLAFAMVSTVRYRSQKYANIHRRSSFTSLLMIALLVVILYRWPAEFWFIGSISYVVSGPLVKLWSIAFPHRPTPPGAESQPDHEPAAEQL
ncbi:MAG: CDP-diacylglycerol--serine O-phosphatidyltransferase [Thermoanaerobaculia bacterium]